jgi:hypothetical protein
MSKGSHGNRVTVTPDRAIDQWGFPPRLCQQPTRFRDFPNPGFLLAGAGLPVREVIARVPCDGGARYMHSFGLTENYVVLVEFPWVFNVAKMFKDTIKKVSDQSSEIYFHWLFININPLEYM